ncbi:hypothetical protein Pfo_003320 [Paulownia fortunei]|nr:hypothetical protein Pfo_003320 [Paulownia fortunei]
MANNSMQTHNPTKPNPIQTTTNQPINLLSVINGREGILSALSDDEYFKNIPPGYRFQPSDKELIFDYLIKKINNEELPRNRIYMVKLYEFNPENLAARFKASGNNEWYFFTPRDKKYKGGSRPNRAAGDGYWKATGADIIIKHNGKEVGYRKSLVYYKGKHPGGTKTNWIMQEFRVKNPPAPVQTTENSMRLDDWVLCKLYKKIRRNRNRKQEANDNTAEVEEEEIQYPNDNTDEVVDEEIQNPHDDTDEVDGEEIQNPTARNYIVALEEPLHRNEAEAPITWTYPQPLNVIPSIRFFNPGESSLSDAIPGVHDIPFNHQAGIPGGHSIPFDHQAGMNSVYIDNFPAPVYMDPSMHPEPQNHILGNRFTCGACPHYPMNHTPMLIPGSQHEQIHGTLWAERNLIHAFDYYCAAIMNEIPGNSPDSDQ